MTSFQRQVHLSIFLSAQIQMYGSLWLNGHHDTKHNVAKHTMHLCSILFMLRLAFLIVLSVVMLYVSLSQAQRQTPLRITIRYNICIQFFVCAECCYSECNYAECCGAIKCLLLHMYIDEKCLCNVLLLSLTHCQNKTTCCSWMSFSTKSNIYEEGRRACTSGATCGVTT